MIYLFCPLGVVIDVESYAKRGGTIVTPAARNPNRCVDHHPQDIILVEYILTLLDHTLDGHENARLDFVNFSRSLFLPSLPQDTESKLVLNVMMSNVHSHPLIIVKRTQTLQYLSN